MLLSDIAVLIGISCGCLLVGALIDFVLFEVKAHKSRTDRKEK